MRGSDPPMATKILRLAITLNDKGTDDETIDFLYCVMRWPSYYPEHIVFL